MIKNKKISLVDKAIISFRVMKKSVAMAMAGGYTGAIKTHRRSLKEWRTVTNDANADILPDLPTLRDRSRDLIRNNPLAGGAIKTKVTNVVGTGLKLQPHIDRKLLNLSKEETDLWEEITSRRWGAFWGSRDCDLTNTMDGNALTRLVYRQAKENGDVFVLFTEKETKDSSCRLKLQIVEADRISNPENAADTNNLAGGVEINKVGVPVKYHILQNHPGSTAGIQKKMKWKAIPAFGRNLGLRNVVHFFNTNRPGQVRGVPDLANVMEYFKLLGDYIDTELMAAVVSGHFTVFVESDAIDNPSAPFDLSNMDDETGSSSSDKDKKLGNGLIVGLAPGEKVHDSNPGRPNVSFDPFVLAILRNIGVGLELPVEVLIKHFTSSFSAARAALLEVWRYFLTERQDIVDNFLRMVYERWMYECVISGRINAPGFLTDISIRRAYLGADFIGSARGQLNELHEIHAAKERIAVGISNRSIEAAKLGRDWEKIHLQSVKEFEMRRAAGLEVEKNKNEI